MPKTNETLVERWTTKLKNQPLVAAAVVVAIVIGGVASLTESFTKLQKFFAPEAPVTANVPVPDYTSHPRLWQPAYLHPTLRTRVERLRNAAAANGINLHYYETYRPPDDQQELFSSVPRLTYADAWQSLKQYGLAATLLPYTSAGWDEKPSDQLIRQLAALATTVGLRQAGTFGQFERLTYVVPGVTPQALSRGEYPSGGDESWATNMRNQIDVWGPRVPSAPPKPRIP